MNSSSGITGIGNPAEGLGHIHRLQSACPKGYRAESLLSADLVRRWSEKSGSGVMAPCRCAQFLLEPENGRLGSKLSAVTG
jgi:hypothetical protein